MANDLLGSPRIGRYNLLVNFLAAMNSCYGYIRVSTVKQGAQGVSLQEQRDAILRYCKTRGIAIVGWFEERETAAKAGRPVFNRMLRLLRRRRASGVVLHKIDRGARNLKDWACLGELIDRNVEIHFANENIDLRSRGGRLSADIQAVVAADFIRNLREETRKGFYGRLKQGLYPIGAPLGYVDCGKGEPKTPDPVTAPLIRYAFETYAAGDTSICLLVEDLHQRGLRNKRGGKVTRNGLSVVLNNPFYAGIIRLRSTGETFPGIHEPIISKSLYDAVQLKLRGKTVRRVLKHQYQYRRLLRCGYCGYSLIGERQKGKVYYRCHTADCETRCVSESSVDEQISTILHSITFNNGNISLLESAAREYIARWTSERNDAQHALKLNRKQIGARIERLTDAYLDGTIEKDLFENRKAHLYHERLRLDEQLANVDVGNDAASARISEFLELSKSLRTMLSLGNSEERRKIVCRLTSNRLVFGKNVVVELRIPFRHIAESAKSTCCDPQRDRPRTFDFTRIFNELIQQSNVEFGLDPTEQQ